MAVELVLPSAVFPDVGWRVETTMSWRETCHSRRFPLRHSKSFATWHSRSFLQRQTKKLPGSFERRDRNFDSCVRPASKQDISKENSFPLNGICSAVMKGAQSPRPENVTGEFFVDHTCIDCDTCRWMAPEIFSKLGNMSAVHHQPEGPEENLKSLQALLACPTASIHTSSPPKDIETVHASFPLPVNPKSLPGVYHCGYHSKLSYGATSYFIQNPNGNILVDSPRFSEKFAKILEDLGGIRYMFLTHRDDVADHAKWAARFNCQRILHGKEVGPNTEDVEMKLQGKGPWSLGPDIDLIFTPGHTEGCVSLLYKPGRALFSGDHLAYSERVQDLSIFRYYNWFSVPEQVESVRKLLSEDFIWLLPGHGRRYFFESVSKKNEKLEELIGRERGTLVTKV